MGTIADSAVKTFSSKHLCKHLKCLKLFSVLAGLLLTLDKYWPNKDFQGLGHKDKDQDKDIPDLWTKHFLEMFSLPKMRLKKSSEFTSLQLHTDYKRII